MDRVLFIPAAVPPHRDEPSVSAEQRLALLCLAIEEIPGFAADRRELDRDGPSYMIDTLSSLRAEFPSEPIALIMGMDAFQGLKRWHRWQDLLKVAHIVVTDRAGYQAEFPADLNAWLLEHRVDHADQLHQSPCGQILFCPIPYLEISASQIRTAIRAGQDPRFLMPDPVYTSIQQQGLYLSA